MNKNIITFLTLIIFSALLFFKDIKAQDNNDKSSVIRVLTYNILHGATTKGDFDFDLIAKVINDCNPDLVALQEIDFKTNRARKYDLMMEMATRTNLIPLFGRAMYYDDGEYGEGILSKYTIIRSRNVALPFGEGYEPRTALEITTVLPKGDTICFVGTHLDHTENDSIRIEQVKAINEKIGKNKFPTILAGDMNDIPNSKSISILKNLWNVSDRSEEPISTYPSDNPNVKIDYIFYDKIHNWEVIDTKVINNPIASDHCAYLTLIKLND